MRAAVSIAMCSRLTQVWSPPVQPLLDIEKSPLSTKKRVGTANKDEAESEEEGDSCSTPLISVKTTVEDDWVNIKCKVPYSGKFSNGANFRIFRMHLLHAKI